MERTELSDRTGPHGRNVESTSAARLRTQSVAGFGGFQLAGDLSRPRGEGWRRWSSPLVRRPGEIRPNPDESCPGVHPIAQDIRALLSGCMLLDVAGEHSGDRWICRLNDRICFRMTSKYPNAYTFRGEGKV